MQTGQPKFVRLTGNVASSDGALVGVCCDEAVINLTRSGSSLVIKSPGSTAAACSPSSVYVLTFTGIVVISDSTTLHTFNGPFSATTHVSWYQKGKTNLDFTEVRDSEWQWHQLGHMQVCTSL